MMSRKDRIRVIRRVLNEHVEEDRGYETPCWIWTGSPGKNQYGAIGVQGKAEPVGRALLAALGELNLSGGRDQCALHKCDIPGCVRPSHLYTGTHQDNTRDSLFRNRRASFAGTNNGHVKLTEEQVLKIRVDPRQYREIAEDFGIQFPAVWKIKHRHTWRHL